MHLIRFLCAFWVPWAGATAPTFLRLSFSPAARPDGCEIHLRLASPRIVPPIYQVTSINVPGAELTKEVLHDGGSPVLNQLKLGRAKFIEPADLPRVVSDLLGSFVEGGDAYPTSLAEAARRARDPWSAEDLIVAEAALALARGQTPGRALIVHYNLTSPVHHAHVHTQRLLVLVPDETNPRAILVSTTTSPHHEFLREIRRRVNVSEQASAILPIDVRGLP